MQSICSAVSDGDQAGEPVASKPHLRSCRVFESRYGEQTAHQQHTSQGWSSQDLQPYRYHMRHYIQVDSMSILDLCVGPVQSISKLHELDL